MATVSAGLDYSLENAQISPSNGIDLLRFTTAGSVDDGKSTLIGRLLYDSRALYEDQIASVRKSRINRSSAPLDLSLFTDGLRAEREQGITIDVAYRYFSTKKRKFIVADTPGHEQYTRNMATGASTADAAVILLDATKGLLPQSRRHAYIATLLGIRHLIAAVNKMDLVDYRQEVFENISEQFRQFANQLGIANVFPIPVSALQGCNIVHAGSNMSWFEGPTLLRHLETLPLGQTRPSGPLRLPIQYVIRPDLRFRGFAGQVASGTLRPGDRVTALPSGVNTRIGSIVNFADVVDHAGPGESVTITLKNEIDLSRGDLLVTEGELPNVSSRLKATLIWFDTEQLQNDKVYLLKHTTRLVRARVKKILNRVNVNTLLHSSATTLHMNDIAAVEIQTTHPLFFDSYRLNRTTGSFILIDPISNSTVAAGMIEAPAEPENSDLVRRERVQTHERIARNQHAPAAIWIRGDQGLAEALEREIFNLGWSVLLIGAPKFSLGESVTAAKVLQAAGTLAVFSLRDEDFSVQPSIRQIYGEEFFLDATGLENRGTDAITEILYWLQRLRPDVPQPGEQR
jgi:sulfate adenylyltransferase subunit 1